jgi:hypothetical protein
MSANEIIEEFDCWKVGLRRCGCGSIVTMHYTPGCTYLHCMRCRKPVAAVPDFNPKELSDQWNEKQTSI